MEYEEMKQIVANQVCAQCGGELTIRTNPDTGKLEVWCPYHPDHHIVTESDPLKDGEKSGEPPAEEKQGEGESGETISSSSEKTQKNKKIGVSAAEPEAEGLVIDPIWLKESLKELKWTDDTTKTFLVSKYKVSPQGTLANVIKRLTRDQADEFVKAIQQKLEQKQRELFP